MTENERIIVDPASANRPFAPLRLSVEIDGGRGRPRRARDELARNKRRMH
jgi:hypothetical protein